MVLDFPEPTHRKPSRLHIVIFLRSLRFPFLLCALFWGLGLVSALRADERIRIVAANLTSGNGQNYDPGHGNRILQGLKPDIVLVQEFNYLSNTAADFRAWVDANFGTNFYYVREPSPGQIPNGVVSRYPIIASGEWNDTDVGNRDFMWARIDIPGDRDLVWAISVHLLTTSSGNRNSEASQILNYIAAQGVPAADYVVLGGDFNTDSRSESCINTLSSYFVTSGPYPVDQSNNGNTNSGRNKPYDWVLADAELHAVKTPVVLGANTFTNGLVFDSRVYSPLPSPVLAGDSAASNMQHMAVVRDFLIPSTSVPAVPAIYSAATASGVAGQGFTYQIAATNGPTAYAASGLPAGLSVNTTSGLISGTPTAAGSATVTLGATNATGTGTATLALTVNAASTGGGGGGGTLLSENMGIPAGTTAISVYATGTAPATFENKGNLTFGQGEQASECDVRSTSVSSGYSGASGGGNVWFASANTRGFSIESINAASYTDLKLNFGYRKELSSVHAALAVDYWNGSAWVSVASTASALFSESTSAGTGWYLSNTLSLPSGAQINGLKIRFVKTGTDTIRIDDIKLMGTPVSTPTLTASGTLAATDTIYGNASPQPVSFTLAGTALTAGILVTPPAGFEVSQTAGGASGYAATQTVGAAGTVTARTIYLRLAADTPAGAYFGLVTCSSPGATPVTMPVAPSTVGLRSLVITANDQSKAFGTVFSTGSSAFTVSGLADGQTIGAVALSAVGGTAQYDPVGAYGIVPSGAAGGTFNAANYSISYVQGTLTVTAPSFAAWASSLADPSADGDPDGDGVANLLEYFQGLNPASADVPAAQIQWSEGGLIFDYRRSKAIDGVAGMVEWTNELSGTVAWSAEGVTDEVITDFGPYETRRATVPMGAGETKKFIHLRVSPL